MSEELAERLAQERREKAARERRDIMQKDVAEEIGTTATSYSRWEAGINVPNDTMLLKLAAYFGVTPGWLRYGHEPRTLPSGAKLARPSVQGEGKKRA